MKKRLFILELKKNIRALPVFFGAMVLMGLVAFLLVFAGSRMLYRNESPLSATIAVVSYEKDSSYVDRLASYLGELSSASKGLKFKIMTEDEARTSLKGGKVFAIMLIPDGMMEGILWGNNIPATVILPDKPDLSSMIFAELTRDGAALLSAAQSGTYTGSYLFNVAGRNDKLGSAYDQIDLINFGYVLERENCYKKYVILPGMDELSAGEASGEPVLIYYICSGILLFVFFSTVAFAGALRRDDPGVYRVYASRGEKLPVYILIKIAAHFTVLAASLIVTYIIAFIVLKVKGTELIPLSLRSLIYVILLSAVMSAFDVFWHMFADRSAGAVLMQLVFSLLMLFAGGAILPKAFLPSVLTKAGEMLPASPLHRGLLNILNGAEAQLPVVLLLHVCLFTVLAVAAALIRSRGERL